MTSGLRVDFFNSGVTKAFLNDDGTQPVSMDRFTNFVMTGISELTCLFSICVGIGSKAHVLVADFFITSLTSFSVATLKVSKVL